MIDLKNVSEIRNVLNNKVIEKIEDTLGNIIYEAWKKLVKYGIPPLTLLKCANKNLVNYQIYGNSKQGRLPDGYTELEYIESTGTQYIDTGIVPDINTQVDYKVRFRENALAAAPLIGARVGSAGTNRFFPISYSNPSTDYRVSLGNTLISDAINFNIDYEGSFQPQNEVTIINGTSYSLAGHSFTKSSNYNLYLFATSGYGSNLYLAKGVIYYCKIYQNGVLVRDLVPCKDSNDIVGMYDIVNNVFYTDEASGNFTAGAEMPNPNNTIEIQSVGDNETGLPLGYTELAYIESNGEQYIDTGITATNNTGMSIKYRYTANGPAGISGIFKSANPRQDVFFISSQTGSLPGTAFMAHRGNTTSTTLGDVSLNTDYTAKINYKNDGKFYYNDNYIVDVGTNAIYNATIPLFGRYSAASGSISVSNARIYYVEFTEGNNISHKFVPCKNASGTIGMYDTIAGVFHTNAGTGTFIAGNEIAKGGYKIPVSVGSKNKFDISKSELGGLSSADGSELTGNTRVRTDYIEIESNYSISVEDNVPYKILNAYFYDSDKNYIGVQNIAGSSSPEVKNYSNTKLSGSTYMRIVFYSTVSASTVIDLNTFKQSKIQIEEGLTATDYEEYFNRTENIYLAEPLRKIGDVDVIKLPSGYTQLEYIESTGTQYIDTDYVPNSKTKIQANVAFTEDTGSMQNFGAIANLGTSSKVNYARWHFGVFQNKLCVFRENTTQSGEIKLDYDNKFHTYEIRNTGCSLDDTSVETDKYTNSNVSFTLFARNGYTSAGGTPSITAYAKSKLKSFKIYEDNILIRDYIPCKNSSDVVGLYDIVNDIFYTNDGTGTFTAGSEIYADYIDFESSKVVRNIGQSSLENYTFTKTASATYGDYFYNSSVITGLNMKTSVDANDTNKYVFANFAKAVSVVDRVNITNAFRIYITSSNFTIRNSVNQEFASASDLQQFLSDKNNYIDYVLATPTEESIELPDILLNKGTNIIDVETSLTPSNMVVKYYGKN